MTDAVALWLGERLLIGSIQGALVIALVWIVCRLVPRIPAAAQSALWWLAALKLALVLAPVPTLSVPLLPAGFEQRTGQLLQKGPAPTRTTEVTAPSPLVSDATSAGAQRPIAWLQSVVLLWFLVVLLQAGRLTLAHRHLRGIIRRAIPWRNEETSELATRLGLKRSPPVLLSDEIDTPQACGLRNPVVLIPPKTMAAFTAEERRMTLCHELMHVRRRDLALGWVPACAERLFFFHPLARLAAREYVEAREAACDAAAVRALGVSAGDYGRMLIRLGIGHARPALTAGGSPFSASSLKRRLRMLERQEAPDISRRWRSALVLIAAAVIPLQLVARTPETPAQDSTLPTAVFQVAPTADVMPERSRSRRAAGRQTSTLMTARARSARQQRADEALKTAQLDLEKAAEQIKAAEAAFKAQEKQAEELTPQQKMLEAMAQIEAARARNAAARQTDQTEEQKQLTAIMALIKSAAARRDAEMLRNTLTIAELLELQNTANDQPRELARHYRQLAEHYEKLAVEQRKLAEELERLRSEQR